MGLRSLLAEVAYCWWLVDSSVVDSVDIISTLIREMKRRADIFSNMLGLLYLLAYCGELPQYLRATSVL